MAWERSGETMSPNAKSQLRICRRIVWDLARIGAASLSVLAERPIEFIRLAYCIVEGR